MSKIAKIILLSFTLAVLITAGTYFISHSSQVSFAHKQNTPHQLAGGICGPSLEYTHEFSYAYAGLDVLIWWAIVFVIFQVSRPNKKQAK
jgi:preprotein translocase subunit YajC